MFSELLNYNAAHHWLRVIFTGNDNAQLVTSTISTWKMLFVSYCTVRACTLSCCCNAVGLCH